MNRIDRIIRSSKFQFHLLENATAENTRPFCSHDFEHLLTVARITWILLLEEKVPFISREMAYAAGLLHDIGRWYEYKAGEDHAACSANLAEPILKAAGFLEAECRLILKAIAQHRLKEDYSKHRTPLSTALSKADRLSRLCFKCKARSQCNKLEKQPCREELIY